MPINNNSIRFLGIGRRPYKWDLVAAGKGEHEGWWYFWNGTCNQQSRRMTESTARNQGRKDRLLFTTDPLIVNRKKRTYEPNTTNQEALFNRWERIDPQIARRLGLPTNGSKAHQKS